MNYQELEAVYKRTVEANCEPDHIVGPWGYINSDGIFHHDGTPYTKDEANALHSKLLGKLHL